MDCYRYYQLQAFHILSLILMGIYILFLSFLTDLLGIIIFMSVDLFYTSSFRELLNLMDILFMLVIGLIIVN